MKHLQKLARADQKPLEHRCEDKQHVDTLTNFIHEPIDHTDLLDSKQSRGLLPTSNNGLNLVRQNSNGSNNERKPNYLAVPQTFDDFPGFKLKNKGEAAFQLINPETGAPSIYRSKTSEADDWKSLIKSKTKSPGLSDSASKSRGSPDIERNSNNSGERGSHDERIIM